MNVEYSKAAIRQLAILGDYVESLNTKNAGERFLKKFMAEIESFAVNHVQFALCNNIALKKRGWSCATIDKWIIAFTLDNNSPYAKVLTNNVFFV